MRLMTPPKSAARAMFLSGQASEALMPLVRNILMARLLVPEQFGLAVALSVVMVVVEQCMDFGLDRFIVQHEPGREDIRRDTIHTLNIARGFAIALLVAALGPFLARWMEAPEAAWAFVALGLASVFRGFMNLGVKELTRDYVYWVDALTLAGTQVMWTVLIAGLYLVFGDYRCMLFAILGAQFTAMVTSHLLSPYAWRPRLDPEIARGLIRAGAPLVPNGMMLAAKNLGDRLVAAMVLGLSAMALYSTAVMSALMPRSIIERFLLTVFLPYFVNAGLDSARDSGLFDVFALMRSLIAATYGLAYLILGVPAVAFVFGSEYLPAQTLVDAVALTIVTKLMLGLIVAPALAYKQTSLVLVGSTGGLMGFGAGVVAVVLTRDLTAMILGFTLVEFVTLGVIIQVASRRFALRTRGLWAAVLAPAAMVLGGVAAIHALPPESFAMRLALLAGALIVMGGVYSLALWAVGLSWTHMGRVILRRRAAQPLVLAESDASQA